MKNKKTFRLEFLLFLYRAKGIKSREEFYAVYNTSKKEFDDFVNTGFVPLSWISEITEYADENPYVYNQLQYYNDSVLNLSSTPKEKQEVFVETVKKESKLEVKKEKNKRKVSTHKRLQRELATVEKSKLTQIKRSANRKKFKNLGDIVETMFCKILLKFLPDKIVSLSKVNREAEKELHGHSAEFDHELHALVLHNEENRRIKYIALPTDVSVI